MAETEAPPPRRKPPPKPKPPQATVNGLPVDPNTPAVRAGGSSQRRRRGGRGRGQGAGRGRGSESGEQKDGRGGGGGGGDHRRDDSQPSSGRQEQDGGGDGANKKSSSGRQRQRRARGRGRGGGRGNNNSVADNGNGNSNATTGVAEEGQPIITQSPPSPGTEQAQAFIDDAVATAASNTNGNGNAQRQTKKNGNAKNKKDRRASNTSDQNQENTATSASSSQQPQPQQQKQKSESEKKKKKKRSNNRKKKKNALLPKSQRPWLDSLPPGADDPISLDPLEELNYPPFVLCVEPPYVPIMPGMWPPPQQQPTAILSKDCDSNIGEVTKPSTSKSASDLSATVTTVNDEDRELAILKEQWGDHQGVAANTADRKAKISDSTTTLNNNPPNNSTADLSSNDIRDRKHFHLFDGRVFAYYLVSQLQFIDPYNRRDLTRPELQALDAYLAHHKLGNAGVVEAYDDTGRTISTAGIAAQSASGRAEILQQDARAIMNSLYSRGRGGGGGSGQQSQQPGSRRQRRDMRHADSMGSLREDEEGNSFQRMYAAQQGGRGGGAQYRGSNRNADLPPSDVGIYGGEHGGFVLIDDDINPGLRSGVPGESTNNHHGAGSGTLYSARQIAERHSQEAQVREGNFPSLSNANPSTATTAESSNGNNGASKKAQQPPAKSLSKMSKLVKKTDPKEVERQRKAREEAQRRAELSKLTFFDPTAPPMASSSAQISNGAMVPTASTAKAPPSEGVLERNRNLAMALGVAPSTVRNGQPALTGWARPVGATAAPTIDEFGNELSAAQYPDALLAEAKERMSELLKLEKQWKKFLADDREASCSLKPMNRPLRKFLHEYSDFWRLHTESFDPEGRRYIYCAKLADTHAPTPLLSDAARRWRGPNAAVAPSVANVNVAALPTGPAGLRLEPSTTSDGWHREQRVPLKLVPRTVAEIGSENTPTPTPPTASTMGGMTRSSSTPFLSMTGERPPPPRFATLHEKERPKLQLAARSIPMWDELENRKISQDEWNAMTPDQQELILKDVEEEERKKLAHIEREKEKEEARIYKLKNKAKKKDAAEVKKRAILESAFASSSDDSDGGGSSGSDWFEGDLEFDGSDDEGM